MADSSGSAFPRPYSAQEGDRFSERAQTGMSLRDWFAGQAVTGLASREAALSVQGKFLEYDVWAKAAYQIADAMLKARVIKEPA